MKKLLVVLVLCVVFVIIYFLHLNFFSWFTIAGIKPNLFIILALFIGLYTNEKLGAILSMIFGFAIDFAGSNLIGGAGLAFGLLIDRLGSSIIRTISNSYGNNRIFTEDILKKIYQKIVKLQ